jgi:hypothetical protein
MMNQWVPYHTCHADLTSLLARITSRMQSAVNGTGRQAGRQAGNAPGQVGHHTINHMATTPPEVPTLNRHCQAAACCQPLCCMAIP